MSRFFCDYFVKKIDGKIKKITISSQIPPIHPRLLRLLVLVAAADVVELAVFDELRAGLVETEGVSSGDTRGRFWCSRARGSSWRECHGTGLYSLVVTSGFLSPRITRICTEFYLLLALTILPIYS